MRSGEVGRGMPPVARFITASGMTNLGDGVAVLAWSWTASLLTRDPRRYRDYFPTLRVIAPEPLPPPASGLH